MTLDQAREHVGWGVVYRPHPDAAPENGQIVSVNDEYVFVLYMGDRNYSPKAARPSDLTLLAVAR